MIILEIDNKSITHRPDMWGHRGFAREIAAILNLPLKHLDLFLQRKPINQQPTEVTPLPSNPFTITNQAPNACKNIAEHYQTMYHILRRCCGWLPDLMRVKCATY